MGLADGFASALLFAHLSASCSMPWLFWACHKSAKGGCSTPGPFFGGGRPSSAEEKISGNRGGGTLSSRTTPHEFPARYPRVG